MKINKPLFAILPFAMLMAACSDRQATDNTGAPSQQGDTQAVVAAPKAVDRIEPSKTRYIHADPAELPDCNLAKVTLKWDTSATGKAPAVVEIYSGTGEKTPGLFAAAGATGEKETGPWVRPGSTFSLRDKSTGAELERLVIGGPRCP